LCDIHKYRSDICKSIISCARRWMWGSQCLQQLPLEVVDDDIIKVVDVLLIGANSWWIHPLLETAVLCLVEYCKRQKNVSKPKKGDETISWTLLTHENGQCQKRRPELFHPSYTCITQNSPCEHLGHNTVCLGS
jgi:hypothetical protein